MKTYLKRLSVHPGVPVATFLSLAFMFAGIANENMGVLDGAIMGLIVSAVPWAIVLLTARTQPLPKDEQ